MSASRLIPSSPFRPWILGTLLALPLLGLAAEPAKPAAADSVDESDEPGAVAETKPDPAAAKFWQAMKLLPSKQPADQAAGRKALQESSDLEYGHAQVMLADCYLSGTYGFPKDARKAVALFRLAGERGNAFALVSLGSCYVTGTGARKDDDKAVEWLQKAVAEKADYSRPTPPADYFTDRKSEDSEVAGELVNDPEAGARASAHFLLGQIETRRNKPAEAQAHYVAAATAGADGRSGIYQAAIEAAINYAFGRGVPRDPAKADEMLEQGRHLGARMGVNLIHSYAALKFVDEFAVADLEEQMVAAGENQRIAVQYEIAHTFADKKSKDYNATQAARWYQLAADSGQVWAMLALAQMYADGELGKPDLVKAYELFEKAGGGDKPKHTLGVANLAICLREGLGTPKDEARAVALFKKFRTQDIVCYLGSIGQPLPKPVSFDEALQLNLAWAKEKNDPVAQFLLAMRYSNGNGVKVSQSESVSWLKKAAKAKQGDALCLLGWLHQFNPGLVDDHDWIKARKDAASCYKASGETGNIEGLANYAVCLANGYGVPRDQAAAIGTYEKCLALDPKHSRSHSNLADVYQQKLAAVGSGAMGTAEWREQMLQHYEASAQEDPPFGALHLGTLYYEGKLVPQDWAKAYHYFEVATAVPTQKAAAHYTLGYMHEMGQGVPVTYTEAAYHYRLSALEGNVPALHRLINFYVTGTGVSLDFDRAIFWLNYLSRLGQIDALPIAADVLMKKGDYANAVKLLEAMTNSFYTNISGHAHERLYVCYASGLGVKQNKKKADFHFKMAIQLGNGDALRQLGLQQLKEGKTADGVATLTRAAQTSATASYNLGQMYFHGNYVAVDRTKAIALIRAAVTGNDTDAMVFLATLTWNREKDAPSLNEALDLATKAENMGNTRGADLREWLEKRRKANGDKPEDDGRARNS